MSIRKRCLMVGAGGMAEVWIRHFWQPLRDRMEFAALVDINRDVLDAIGDFAGVPPKARFTDAEKAFSQVEADFCCIVTPPAFHQEAIERACARGLDILCEKPISDSWDGCCSIFRTVREAGVRMQVTQNYRYNANILALKKAIAELGAVNYLVGRYASDYRVLNSWGAFRHQIAHSLLVEGGVHHLDQIRNLSSANCSTITGFEWNPGQVRGDSAQWRGSDSFQGEPCALFNMQMTTGAFAHYEGNNLETGRTNTWLNECYRAECEGGTAVLDNAAVVRVEKRSSCGTLKIHEIPIETSQSEGHHAVVRQFLEWLEGGSSPSSTLADNIQSNAMVFAAIEASRHKKVIDVQEMIRTGTQ